MIVLPPPAITVECVKPADIGSLKIKSWMVVSGDERAVQTWLEAAAKQGVTDINGDQHNGGEREVSLPLPENAAYRTIGALIYLGQAGGLVVTMKTEPPICGAEAK